MKGKERLVSLRRVGNWGMTYETGDWTRIIPHCGVGLSWNGCFDLVIKVDRESSFSIRNFLFVSCQVSWGIINEKLHVA